MNIGFQMSTMPSVTRPGTEQNVATRPLSAKVFAKRNKKENKGIPETVMIQSVALHGVNFNNY